MLFHLSPSLLFEAKIINLFINGDLFDLNLVDALFIPLPEYCIKMNNI